MMNCPDKQHKAWKPANVVCSLCGGTSHVDQDCPGRRSGGQNYENEYHHAFYLFLFFFPAFSFLNELLYHASVPHVRPDFLAHECTYGYSIAVERVSTHAHVYRYADFLTELLGEDPGAAETTNAPVVPAVTIAAPASAPSVPVPHIRPPILLPGVFLPQGNGVSVAGMISQTNGGSTLPAGGGHRGGWPMSQAWGFLRGGPPQEGGAMPRGGYVAAGGIPPGGYFGGGAIPPSGYVNNGAIPPAFGGYSGTHTRPPFPHFPPPPYLPGRPPSNNGHMSGNPANYANVNGAYMAHNMGVVPLRPPANPYYNQIQYR
jgi:hypothetical protein